MLGCWEPPGFSSLCCQSSGTHLCQLEFNGSVIMSTDATFRNLKLWGSKTWITVSYTWPGQGLRSVLTDFP